MNDSTSDPFQLDMMHTRLSLEAEERERKEREERERVKPCGHCGYAPAIIGGEDPHGWRVVCRTEHCDRPETLQHTTRQEAIDEWNEETV